jgi:hypothetical protein
MERRVVSGRGLRCSMAAGLLDNAYIISQLIGTVYNFLANNSSIK